MSSEQGMGAKDEPLMSEPFDQTNGVVDGLGGDSDGTAEAESGSATTDQDGDFDGPGITDPGGLPNAGVVQEGQMLGPNH